MQTDVGKKNSLSCHSEPPPLRSRGGGWWCKWMFPKKLKTCDIWTLAGHLSPPLGQSVEKAPEKWKICHLSPPPSSRGMGVQMNVERYEDVKMFSQSEPPPEQLRGACK